MSNLQVKDGANSAKYIKADGAGSDVDPHITHVNIAAIIPGTGATALGKAEDAAHSSGDTGVMALAVRRDTPAAGGADGDYVALSTDSDGALRVTSAGGGSVEGDVAHDAADSGNPVKIGGKAETTIPAAVSDGDRVDAFFNEYGEQCQIVGARTVTIEASFTRPADTNAYAAGDVVCDSTSAPTDMDFTSIVRKSGGSGVILSALLIDGANQATKLDCELFLFDTAITMDNDNAGFTPTDTELGTLIGVIDFGGTPFNGDATSGAGGNAVYQQTGLNIAFKAVSGSTIYGVLVARNAYTPTSSETFKVRLSVLQD